MPDAGLIIAIISALVALTGPLRLLGGSRRDYFDMAIGPYFKSFDKAHLFYSDLFVWARGEIDKCKPSMPDRPHIDIAHLLSINTEFQSRRATDEHFRDDLRREAQDILREIRWKEERRFLMSVINYFTGEGGIAPSDDSLDIRIDQIIEQGGETIISSPSVALYLELNELVKTGAPDIELIIDRLDRARSQLNQSYVNVRRSYRRARDAALLGPV